MIELVKRYLSEDSLILIVSYYLFLLIDSLFIDIANNIYLDFSFCIIRNILLFLIVYFQRKHFNKSNISKFSIILLLLVGTETLPQIKLVSLGLITNIINFSIVLIFLISIYRANEIKIDKKLIKYFIFFMMGLLVGIFYAIIKMRLNHNDYLELAISNPKFFFASLLLSFTVLTNEVFFRGIVWGSFRKKGINDIWIILISTLLWSSVSFSQYQNVAEFLNILYLGLFAGVLVKITKSVDVSIGLFVGYSSFLFMKLVYFS